MRIALALVALVALAACDPEVTELPPTQITVRLWGSALVEQQTARLRVVISKPSAGSWRANKPVLLPLEGLAWPIDVPVVPGEGESNSGRFEIVVGALDAAGTTLAEVRHRTSFVPRDQRKLELRLIECPGEQVCAGNPQCHDEGCHSCMASECPTPDRPGSQLAHLNPDESVGTNPIGATDEDAGAEPSPDAGGDAGGCSETLRCIEGRLEECKSGTWSLKDECDFACHENACTGICKPGDVQCGGSEALVPQVCGEDGQWKPNPDVNGGAACPFLCDAGACTGECIPTSAQCSDNMRQVCSNEGAWGDDRLCADLCRDGVCSQLSSCSAGLSCVDNESCCVSHVVPGGTFYRSYDATYFMSMEYEATVSPFRLDRFEVTVGRFRAWTVAFGEGAHPVTGDGKNLNNEEDSGWSANWGVGDELPSGATELREQLAACSGTTWTTDPGDNEDKPINCVTWYEAMAFCIWDRGRLPTEAEWNFAASGGSEQRIFPWSTLEAPEPLGEEYAVYYPQAVAAVGSRPKGDGLWKQADLGGNVEEWLLDWFQDPYGLTPCDDCADFQETGLRVVRGGAYAWLEDPLYNGNRSNFVPKSRSGKVGFRCARAE
jgi:sulfatase modifying factor 1